MWSLELFRTKQHSLAKQYLYFTIAVITLIILIILWISFSTYHSYKIDKNYFLEKEGQKLVSEVDEKFTYIEHFLKFIGTKVNNSPSKDDETITSIIKHHTDNFRDDIFSWHAIYFTRKDGLLIADSVNGSVPIRKITKEKRSWIESAKKEPWKLKLAKPDIGVISKDYVISSAIGIHDNIHDKFIGYISAGVSIEKLTSRLLQIMGDEISFVILDQDMNFIATSEPIITEKNFMVSDTIAKEISLLANSPNSKLSKPFEVHNYIFSHFYSSPKYPLYIFVGQNKHYYFQELKEELLPRIVLYISLGIIFTSILLFLGYQVIKPIIELGRAADNISKGKKPNIPNYSARELTVLSEQLTNIDEINRNLRRKQNQLSEMNSELANANEFIKSNMSFLSHELTNPISTIMGFAKILRGKLEKFKDEETKQFVELIHKASIHQNKQLTFFLKLFQFQEAHKTVEEKEIDLKELIEWNISMINHHLKEKSIAVKITVSKNLGMFGDEIMIGQLVQNLAANAAKYNKVDGVINIRAYVGKKTGKLNLEIEDTGIGIAKEDLDRIFKKFTRIKNKESSKSLGYGIGLAYAKECAIAHEGVIRVKSTLTKGTTFRVTFPKHRVRRIVSITDQNVKVLSGSAS